MRYVLSDLDGVLVDSGDAVERVWREWAIDRGVDPDAVIRAMHGVPARGVLEQVAPHLVSDAEIERIDALHAATGGDALPGAAELLDGLPPDRLAVVTSCSPPLAAARLRAASLPTPDVLITSDLTPRGKPHPDPYLAAAAALGADPADCVVIEDAPAGIAAGRAAGMTVWAVTTTHSAVEVAEADGVFADLAAVNSALRSIEAGPRVERPCPGCGLDLPAASGPTHPYIGASAACWARYGELLAREYGPLTDAHRLTVDAYAVQHPGKPERRAIQSVAVHLMGLHLVLDREQPPAHVTALFRRILPSLPPLHWLEPPHPNGSLTVQDVLSSTGAEDHRDRVRAWATDVWAAWSPHHETVHAWLAHASGDAHPPPA